MSVLVLRNIAVAGRHQAPCVNGAVFVQRRHDSSATNLAALKRGRGGRSSFSGIVATVFGASGFVGSYVVNKLGKIGSQVIIPYRGDPYDVAPLKLCGDLGQILFLPYELRNEESVRQAMQYSNVVVNLIGREYETKNYKLNDVNVEGSRRIARLARECGVSRLIHFSALNASLNPQIIYMKQGSQYLITKAKGELAVKEEFPDATIFRPADIYGQEDRFLRYYSNYWRRSTSNSLGLWKKGRQTIKQPVFVSDVAAGVVAAIRDPSTAGKTFEIVGPHRYYLCDIIDYIYKLMRYEDFKITNVSPLLKLTATVMGMMPNYPRFNMEKVEAEHVTDVVTGLPNLEDLGVELTRLEDRADYELKPYRLYAYYEDKLGEFPKPNPPEKVLGL
ncbi:NADH dehydrogenase [ubiquinone] 1 alpha subcomplex subunit 9, mitochondrial-like [Liolophura sinensis]|uniref:NADH dehydrogenase [ubiquinone] 1 alpha subcomplex subunit 9, mitochondrial-like n=1 Tax=Liolophura sinensis TaxID=3198878 RepID=UPI0031591621